MKTTVLLLVAIFVVAFVVLIVLMARQRERARQAQIAQWAASRGWTVTLRPGPIEWCSRLPGRNRRGVSQILSGTVDRWPVSVAEYSYTTTTSTGDGGTTTTTHHFIVTVVRLASSYAPVAVQPRGGISRMGRALVGDNAASTGDEDFDRQFRVKTQDPASRALVGPTLIAEHLAGRIPAWSLAGQDLLAWQQGRLTDPTRIEALTAGLVRVASLIGR
ncbi:hypothetical protein [Mycobacterium sp.]|uniref:hypothetical protein n=1 Tax=Mycobacterium sp. TaxID=1785 RepID=UPI003C711054